uniref:Glucuronosyltransferase n=1 Tax=Meloidogyne incognita TaxID=6306 RepID=A0A914NE44_MELIC
MAAGFGSRRIEQMISLFGKYKNCVFKARLDLNFLPNNIPSNVVFTDKIVKQQNILAKSNTKLFISHCGLNSLNEAFNF